MIFYLYVLCVLGVFVHKGRIGLNKVIRPGNAAFLLTNVDKRASSNNEHIQLSDKTQFSLLQ